jgi:ApeA N-terminal domain 1
MELISGQFFRGYWKLPEEENFRLSGDLNFDHNNGGILKVMGSFGKQNERTGEEVHPIINGLTTEGKRVTLVNCKGYGNYRLPGIPTLELSAEIILIGKEYIEDQDDLLFDGVNFHFKYLDEWIEVSGFEKNLLDEESLSINYKQPSPIVLHHSNTEDIVVWFSYKGPTLGYFIKKNSISQKTLIEIDFKQQMSTEYIFRKIDILKNLISFGLSQTTYTTTINLFRKASDGKANHFDVLIPTNFFNDNGSNFVNPSTMLFSFADIKINYRHIFSSWLNLCEKLNPVFELYFQSIHNTYLGSENYFLNLMFAIETYHRRISDDSKFSLDEYAKITTSLNETIRTFGNKKYEEWLNGLLRYGNEASLRKRLRSILEKTHFKLSEKINDKEWFISKILDTRNFLVHYDTSLESKIIQPDEFFSYNLKLKVLLQLCLLQELGFEDSQIGEFIVRTPTFWNVD